MDSEINRIIKWFKNNVFLFDKENHETLKKSDFEYVDGKIYFNHPFLQIFEMWRKTNPENLASSSPNGDKVHNHSAPVALNKLHDREEFLKWAAHQWLARIRNKDYYTCVTMAGFYQA